MIIIITSILGVLLYTFRKQIRQFSGVFFALTTVLAIGGYVVDFELITVGTLGLVFILLVMFAGAFKKTSKVGKGLKSIRKELSIMGFILLIPHFWKYLIEFINGEYPWEWYGLVGAVIMIPLFVTSFTRVKRALGFSTWKKIQRYSYLAYILIFIHLIVVANEAESIVYSLLFVLYVGLKYKNYFSKSENTMVKRLSGLSVVATLLFVVIFAADIQVGAFSTSGATISVAENIDLNSVEDGTYYGSADGFKSRIVEVEVTVRDNEIVSVEVLNYGSTSPHKGIDFYDAVDQVVEEVLETSLSEVDSISGATKSTEGALHAIEDALS